MRTARSLSISMCFAVSSALVVGPLACGANPTDNGGSTSSIGSSSGSSGSTSGSGSGTTSGSGSGTTSGGSSGSSSGSGSTSGSTSGSSGSTGGSSGSSSGSTSGSSSGGSSGGGSGSTSGSSSGSSGGSSGSSSGGSSGSGSGGTGGGYACNLILGVSASGEWINQGGFFNLVDGTRWEAITKAHEYIELWANPSDAVWSQQFDPPPPSPASASHTCAQNAKSPDRVIFIAYTDPTNTTYQSESGWETTLKQDVATIKMKYPSVQNVEILTMIRGPMTQGAMTYPGGYNCDPALKEDIVQPYTDQAIAAVAMQDPTVTVGPKFYVGDCTWWCTNGSGTGPHFICQKMPCTPGKPDLAAKMIADYYNAHP